MNTSHAETADSRWSLLYKIGGAAALFGVAVIPIQLIIFIAWGQPDTAIGWFKLFQDNRLAGLLAFEFLFVVNAVLGIATTLALYVALRRGDGRDPHRPLGGAPHLRFLPLRRLFRPGLGRRSRPLVADRLVEAEGPWAAL